MPSKRISRWLRWAVALAAMLFVARKIVLDPAPLHRIWQTGPRTLLGMCALTALNQALMSLRFAQVIHHMSPVRLSFAAWFRLTSVGQMLNLFVPQLGSVYRGVVLKRDYGVSLLTWATGLVSFVWLDMVGGMLIAIATIAILDPHLRFAGMPGELLLVAALSAIFFGPILAAFVLERLPTSSGLVGRTQRRLTTLLSTASSVARHPGLMARFFALNLVVTTGQTATLWMAFHSVGAAIPLSGLLLFQVFVKLSNQVAITPGNLGIMELAFGALSRGSAHSVEQGLAVSLLLRAVGTIMTVVLGVLAGGAGSLFGGRRTLLEQADELAPQAQDLAATKK